MFQVGDKVRTKACDKITKEFQLQEGTVVMVLSRNEIKVVFDHCSYNGSPPACAWTFIDASEQLELISSAIAVASPKELPCSNPTCRKMNDVGVKQCWNCEAPYPTGL